MLLLVEVQGEPFIADTGFGGLTLTAPIRLVADIVQDTPHGPYRLLHRGETFLLQAKAKNEWLDLYAFDLTQYYQPDYQVFNWYTATHPRSEEHTSELQSLMRISYAVFCLKKKKNQTQPKKHTSTVNHQSH